MWIILTCLMFSAIIKVVKSRSKYHLRTSGSMLLLRINIPVINRRKLLFFVPNTLFVFALLTMMITMLSFWPTISTMLLPMIRSSPISITILLNLLPTMILQQHAHSKSMHLITNSFDRCLDGSLQRPSRRPSRKLHSTPGCLLEPF
jgi:hypothetical protein